MLSFSINLGIEHWKQTVNPQLGKSGLCPVPLSWAFCARLWVTIAPENLSCYLITPFWDRRISPCLSHDMVVKVEPAKSSIGILAFSSGYSVCLGTTDSIMASGSQGLLRQEPLIQTAFVCSYKHAADFTFINYSSANTDAPCEPCPDFHPL